MGSWRFLKISIIYSQNLHFSSVFLNIFRKLQHAYAEHTRKRFYRMLSIRGTDFIAHWAYEERISAHAEPAVKCEQFLHVQSMLSIRGTNFIAHWAYAERSSSHAEHTWNRKCLKVEYLGWIEYDFQTSRVASPWDHMVSVSAKKVKKKISCLCNFNRWQRYFRRLWHRWFAVIYLNFCDLLLLAWAVNFPPRSYRHCTFSCDYLYDFVKILQVRYWKFIQARPSINTYCDAAPWNKNDAHGVWFTFVVLFWPLWAVGVLDAGGWGRGGGG
jgi:hypothetical protein